MSDLLTLLHVLGAIAGAVRFILLLIAAFYWCRERYAKSKNKPKRTRRRREGQARPPRARSKGGRRRRAKRFA